MSHQNGMLPVFVGGSGVPLAAVLALPGDDAHADEVHRQPARPDFQSIGGRSGSNAMQMPMTT